MVKPRPQRPDIHTFTDYRAFLAAQFAYLKATKPRFSLRSLKIVKGSGSGATTYYSAQFLHKVLRGEKPLPIAMIPGLARALGLTAAEALFLDRLVRYAAADEPTDRQDHFRQLARRTKFRERQAIGSRARLDFITHGLVGDIYLLTALPSCRADAHWLNAHLAVPATATAIDNAVTVLLALGLVVRRDGHLLRVAGARPEPAPHEVELHRMYHSEQAEKARRVLLRVSPDDRQFHTWGVTRFSRGAYQAFARELSERVRVAVAETVAKYESRPGEPGDVVAQVNLQVFPVSKPEGGTP